MTIYTTPTIQLVVDADLTGNDVFATFSQGSTTLTKQIPEFTVDGGKTNLSLMLTQEETGNFNPSERVQIQVNFISASGDRGATNIQIIPTFDNLLNEVISNEED